jgi:hypothetical protein
MSKMAAPRRLRPRGLYTTDEVIDEIMMNSDSDNTQDSDNDTIDYVFEDDDDDNEPAAANLQVNHGNGEWTEHDSVPNLPAFTGTPGMNVDIDIDATPSEYFNLFIDEGILELMARETNRYANDVMANIGPLKEHSRMRKWKQTTVAEMKQFTALLFMMGLVDKPTIESYWAVDAVMYTPFASSVMSRDRFILILKFFHLNDNSTAIPRGQDGHDKLHKVRPLMEHLQRKFGDVYTPKQDVSIDETMVPWTGRLGWKQYIPMKPVKYGMKLYQLCEAGSGFVHSFKVYTGKEGNIVEKDHAAKVVKHLGQNLLDKGYIFWMDNFYSGIQLFEELRQRNTLACGTMRINRKGIPPAVKDRKLKKGEHIFRRKDNMLVLKWQDKKTVTFLSTTHTADFVDVQRHGKDYHQPLLKESYDHCMSGVDICDQNVGYYSMRRKTMKWSKKLAFYFLNVARYQSYLLQKIKAEKPLSQLQFTSKLVHQLIEDTPVEAARRGRPSDADIPTRLTDRHFLKSIPPTEKKEKPTKRCIVCSVPTGERRKRGVPSPHRHETRYLCDTCNVALCVTPCFKRYHTLRNYKQGSSESDTDSD